MPPKNQGFERKATRGMSILKCESARRLLLIPTGVILAWCLMEFPALINVFDYRRIGGPAEVWWGKDNVPDRELLHLRRPHSHFSGAVRGGLMELAYQIPPSDMTHFRWDVEYDDHGFRNEVDLKSADMVVIGDSFVEAMTVPTAQLMTSLLAHLQGKVVANLGQPDYGPQQELIVLRRYGLPLRPRTVLWMFYEGNDLEDVVRCDKAMRNSSNFWRAFLNRSLTRKAFLEVRRLFFAPSEPPGATRSGFIQTAKGEKLTLYFFCTAKPLTKEDLSALDETRRILAAAYQLCAAQGSRLVIVLVPDAFRVFHDFCRFPPESQCRTWVLDDMPQRLERAVGSVSSQIGYLDLTPSLVEGVKKGAIPYYRDDTHWNEEGNEIAAEAINHDLSSTE
jgi:hypothetical protein